MSNAKEFFGRAISALFGHAINVAGVRTAPATPTYDLLDVLMDNMTPVPGTIERTKAGQGVARAAQRLAAHRAAQAERLKDADLSHSPCRQRRRHHGY